MRFMSRLVLLLVLCPGLVWANPGFRGPATRFPVAQVDAATFEVIARGGRVNARRYWCAAGFYGLAQGIPSSNRIYLAVAEGPSVTTPGRKAVRFTFDPVAAGVTPIAPPLSLSVKAVGDNMSVVAAQQLCGSSGAFGF